MNFGKEKLVLKERLILRVPNTNTQLREILNDFNWDEEVITELLYNLTEKRNPGDTWQTKSGWAGLKPGEDSARYGMSDKELLMHMLGENRYQEMKKMK